MPLFQTHFDSDPLTPNKTLNTRKFQQTHVHNKGISFSSTLAPTSSKIEIEINMPRHMHLTAVVKSDYTDNLNAI